MGLGRLTEDCSQILIKNELNVLAKTFLLFITAPEWSRRESLIILKKRNHFCHYATDILT